MARSKKEAGFWAALVAEAQAGSESVAAIATKHAPSASTSCSPIAGIPQNPPSKARRPPPGHGRTLTWKRPVLGFFVAVLAFAPPARIELATLALGKPCSIQL